MLQTHAEVSQKRKRKSTRAVRRETLGGVRVGIKSKGNDSQLPYFGGGRGKEGKTAKIGKAVSTLLFSTLFLKI